MLQALRSGQVSAVVLDTNFVLYTDGRDVSGHMWLRCASFQLLWLPRMTHA